MPSSGHQASGRAMKVPVSSYSDGLNSGMGSPDPASRSLRSPSAADLIPSATSVSASRNSTDPAFGPAPSSVSRSLIAHLRRCTASATTARTSRRLVMPRTASATARAGITYRTGPALPDPPGHPGRPVQLDEPRVAALPGRRDQDVHDLRQLGPDVVAAQRGRAGDQAAVAGVQQRGHLLLQGRRRAGRGHVHPGQQPPPRPARPQPVPQGMFRSGRPPAPGRGRSRLAAGPGSGRGHPGPVGSMVP